MYLDLLKSNQLAGTYLDLNILNLNNWTDNHSNGQDWLNIDQSNGFIFNHWCGIFRFVEDMDSGVCNSEQRINGRLNIGTFIGWLLLEI